MVTLASGSRAALRHTRERVKAETPAGLLAPVTDIAAQAVGTSGAKYGSFIRSSGSWIDDGFVYGQVILASGFTTAATNKKWVVAVVTALELEVFDRSDEITDETQDSGQQVQIVMEKLRATGRNINRTVGILESGEVDEDGQQTDVRHGFNRIEGSPGFQLSYLDFDTMLENALGGAWVRIEAQGAPNYAVSASAKTFVRDSGSFITDGFRPGDIIHPTGFSTGNNGYYRVLSVVALTLTVLDPDSELVDQASGGTGTRKVNVAGKRLDLTPFMYSLLVERAFLDVEQFQVFHGVVIDKMSLDIQPEAMIGGTLSLLGMSADAMTQVPISDEDPADPSGSAPYAAFDGAIYEGGTEIGVVTSLNIELARNRSLNPVVGSKFSPDVFEGVASVTGTLTAYFEDETLYNKFANETSSSLWCTLVDPSDPTLFTSIVLPRVKYVSGQMDPPQQGPVPIEMQIRGLKATGLAAPGGTLVNTALTIQRSNQF